MPQSSVNVHSCKIVGLLSDKVHNDYNALDMATDEWAQRFQRKR